jgi:hypothetical protein
VPASKLRWLQEESSVVHSQVGTFWGYLAEREQLLAP